MLANATDPERAEDVRPEFIDTVRALQPIDAMILEALAEVEIGRTVGQSEIVAHLKRRETAAIVSLEHLQQLKCATVRAGGVQYSLTIYGRELMTALRPRPTPGDIRLPL
ncbi:DUF4393 domain-containing protein [Bradyrhizobium cenepequi]|uniref:DUF4393 domain-containing protein n=1 Tax=Bradyrhizobium cenepequi TaxID=2821403 RepID=UPI001CE2DE00